MAKLLANFSYLLRGNKVTIRNRKISTYINALAKAGFMVEQLIEETNSETLANHADVSYKYYSSYKAQKLPMSFVMKARRI